MASNNSYKQLNPEDAIDIPLAEVDSKVSDDTFCVISYNWGQTFVHRYSRLPSLYLFYPYSSIRRSSIAFTTHPGYDIGLLVIVFGNLVDLAIPNSMPPFFDRVSIMFYFMEALYQSLSRGFVLGQYSYLRNPWMCFDFIITLVSMSHLEFTESATFAIQSLRGIRILNLITIVPGVRTMAQAVVLSLTQIFGVLLFFLFFIISVTVSAKHIFKGVLLNKCVRKLPNNFGFLNTSYADFINNTENWLPNEYAYLVCGNLTGARQCPEDYVCLPNIGDYNYNLTHFDTFGASLLNSLVLVTHDDWGFIIDEVLKAVGPVSALFFVPVIYLASFCMLNLIIVVVIVNYEAIVEVNKLKHKDLSAYTYHRSFKFDIEQLSLFPLPTNEKTLNRIVRERDDLKDHRKAVQKTWRKMKDIIALKQDVLKTMKDSQENRINHQAAEDFSVGKQKGVWLSFRKVALKITETSLFRYFILSVVILNTIFLALEHNFVTEEQQQIYHFGNLVFIIIYSLEMLLMLTANGWAFFYDWWNLFDLLVVIHGIASLLIHSLTQIVTFRVLRLIKLFKIQKEWSALRKVTTVVLSSFGNIIRLLIVMSLLVCMFAIIGNYVLGPLYNYREDMERLRWSFATFGGSLFTVFEVFTGEWTRHLWNCMNKSQGSVLCSIILINYFFIGNLVFMSLFAALFLRSFNETEQIFTPHKGKLIGNFLSKVCDFLCCVSRRKKSLKRKTEDNIETDDPETKEKFDTAAADAKSNDILAYIKEFIRSDKFDYIIYAVIFADCIVMALDDANAAGTYYKSLQLTYSIISGIYFLEMLLRWLGNGIVDYFTNGWTLFDFALVIITVIDILITHIFEEVYLVSAMRVLRALRPMKIISRWHEMRMILGAFVLSLPVTANVILVCLFIWLPFAIMGIHLFSGNFHRCINNEGLMIHQRDVFNKTDCLQKNYTWENMFMNFDNIGNSYLSLFLLAKMDGWEDLIQIMVDFKGNDLQPEKDYHQQYYAFVIVFIFIGGFFSFNLFVGVAVDTFKNMHKQVKGGVVESELTENQRVHYHALQKFSRRKPVILIELPKNRFFNVCYRISQSWWFRVTIFIFICGSAITVAVDSHNNTQLTQEILRKCELAFTCVFLLEFLIKILGLQKYYFNDLWNIFDFVILISFLIGEILHFTYHNRLNIMSFMYAFRIFRIFRLLHLTNIFVDLRLLTYAIGASFIPLLNLSLLLFLIIFVYSIIGMSVFGSLKFTRASFDNELNFRTWIRSSILLFNLISVEEWAIIYEDLSLGPPNCQPDPEEHYVSSCGSKVTASIYMLSYLFLTNSLLTNIFIAIIYDSYKAVTAEDKFIFKEDNLIGFYQVWKRFDPKATQFIPYESLSTFLDELNRDLRISKPNHVTIAFMNLPIAVGNKVHCLDVLKGILKAKMGTVEDTEIFRVICDEMQGKYEKLFPNLKGSRFIQTTMNLKRMDRAARIIQTRMKQLKDRRSSIVLQTLQRRKYSAHTT